MVAGGKFRRRYAAAALAALAGGMLVPAGVAAAASGRAGHSAPAADHVVPAGSKLFVPPPASGALEQILSLALAGEWQQAALIGKMVATPQAVWFDGGTPAQVRRQVSATMAEAQLEHALPVLVAYDIPGRDCDQYSAGGALDEAAYDSWIAAFAGGIGDRPAIVILEPDALGNMPSDCLADNSSLDATNYPFSDAERIAELGDAVSVLEADPRTAVYLDGTHSAWQSVGTIAERLAQAGVQDAQGFFLNVSNYQYTTNNVFYGTWISDCLAYATTVDPGNWSNCPNQYYNGGPSNSYKAGVALSPYGVWSDGNASFDLNTAGEDSHYAQLLGSTLPTTHFVIDTSRNGLGPNDMAVYAQAPYDQPASDVATLETGNWCNPPGSGLGLAPTTSTGVPLVDAYLWVKIPGESDGQCDAAGGVRAWDYSDYSQPGWPSTAAGQSTFDPLWGLVDPAAGNWFPAQALMLAESANPPLR